MEGGIHKRRWTKKASLHAFVLFLCVFPAAVSSVSTCPYAHYLNDKGICCLKCLPGYKVEEDCKCVECPSGQYIDAINYSHQCRGCSQCKAHEEQVSQCESYKNTVCRCQKGYYKYFFDSLSYECRLCKRCGQHEREAEECTQEKNTVCECQKSFHRVNNQCELCKNCTAGCEHYCLLPNGDKIHASCPGKEYAISMICGVIAAAVVLLLIVAVITYKLTERFVQKKLLKSLSQSSDSSPDSCEQVLIQHLGPLNNLSTRIDPLNPLIENEQPSKLPDCVPLEIKISELIYKVLDLVPVLQVKQLVRCLGVKDTDIEQAELDHRSCREAHYQMLRIWAERGVRGGGLLHCSFLQELLDELRKMHLENAAEEIETNYVCQ